jgi:cytochrome c
MKYVAAMFTASTLVAANLAVAGLAAQSATPLSYGEELFAQRCRACHSVTTAKPNLIGPNLAGVVGRKAAATAFNYSPALKNSKLIWTKANLDRYLAAPARAVPGTKMFMAVPDAKQRTAIVTFLEKTK